MDGTLASPVDLKDLCGFPLNPNDFYVSSRRPLLLTENCTNPLHSLIPFAFIDPPRPDKCAVLFDNPSRPQYHYTMVVKSRNLESF